MLGRTVRVTSICRPAAIIGCAALVGCAAPPRYQPEPILCLDRPQCDAMWSRAQLFIVQKSGYRLQVATDSVLQTFGPMGASTALAFTVTRELAPDGSGVISMSAACDNMFGCIPSVTLTGQQFRDYLINVPARR